VLVQQREGSIRLVRQNDHALLSGRLAAQWIGDGDTPPDFDTVLAIALHDLSWADADREPRFDPDTGGVVDFTSWSDPDREPLQTAGLDLVERVSPFAALLGSLHYERFLDPDEFPDFAAGEKRRQQRLGKECGLAPDDPRVEAGRRLLRHLDVLSLLICLTGPGTTDAPGWLTPERVGVRPDGERYDPRWTDEGTLVCDPFPFAGRFTVAYPWRELEPPFASEQDLSDAWAAAPVRFTEVVVRPTAAPSAG
jgi:hypothetical protein